MSPQSERRRLFSSCSECGELPDLILYANCLLPRVVIPQHPVTYLLEPKCLEPFPQFRTVSKRHSSLHLPWVSEAHQGSAPPSVSSCSFLSL